jgi:hypothetical protein
MDSFSGSCRFFKIAFGWALSAQAAKSPLWRTTGACAWLAASCLSIGCPLSDEFFLEQSPRDASTVTTGAGGFEAGTDPGGGDARGADAKISDAAAMEAALPMIELARSKSVLASTEQTSRANLAPLGNDGDPSTRWSASEALTPSWWRVDLGAAHHLSRVEIDWEFARPYGYLIEVSGDDIGYSTVVNRSASTDSRQNQSADIDVNARYVRITVTALTVSPITWPSFWELRVLGQ